MSCQSFASLTLHQTDLCWLQSPDSTRPATGKETLVIQERARWQLSDREWGDITRYASHRRGYLRFCNDLDAVEMWGKEKRRWHFVSSVKPHPLCLQCNVNCLLKPLPSISNFQCGLNSPACPSYRGRSPGADSKNLLPQPQSRPRTLQPQSPQARKKRSSLMAFLSPSWSILPFHRSSIFAFLCSPHCQFQSQSWEINITLEVSAGVPQAKGGTPLFLRCHVVQSQYNVGGLFLPQHSMLHCRAPRQWNNESQLLNC